MSPSRICRIYSRDQKTLCTALQIWISLQITYPLKTFAVALHVHFFFDLSDSKQFYGSYISWETLDGSLVCTWDFNVFERLSFIPDVVTLSTLVITSATDKHYPAGKCLSVGSVIQSKFINQVRQTLKNKNCSIVILNILIFWIFIKLFSQIFYV